VSGASLILTDRSLALSEPKAVGAQGSTKVLAASSLGSCLVFVSSAALAFSMAGPIYAHDSEAQTVTKNFEAAIPNIPSKSLIAVEVDYAPGAASAPHTHAKSAFIYAYVISGAIESKVNDGEPCGGSLCMQIAMQSRVPKKSRKNFRVRSCSGAKHDRRKMRVLLEGERVLNLDGVPNQ
jgi:hypothetical protein